MPAGLQIVARSGTRINISELCVPVSNNEHHTRLRSAQHSDLIVPHVKLTKYGQRTFTFAGPSAWNDLSTELNDYNLALEAFKRGLKTQKKNALFS